MNTKIKLAITVALLATMGQSALADDVWFSKWDRNHDNRWSYNEFAAAHRSWARHHRHAAEAAWKEKELRHQWEVLDAEHHGWVTPEQVRTFHEW